MAQAKARLSELIETAQRDGAQEITRNGTLVGVLVPPQDWNQHTRQVTHNARTTHEFFANSPLANSGMKLERSKSKMRKVRL